MDTKLNDRIKSVLPTLKKFTELYFTHNYGIMLTGSILTEFFNEESDIDVIYLSNLYRNIFIESYRFEDMKIQAIVLPIYDLENVIRRDTDLGNGIYVHQLNTGKIIYDPMGMLGVLKTKVEQVYAKGPNPMSRFQFNQLRSRITSRHEDLKGSNDISDNVFSLFDLYPRITDLFFQEHRHWPFHGKSASREIKRINPGFHSEMIDSIKALIQEGDKSKAIGFVSKFLNSIGGEIHFYSTREFPNSVSSDSLVIFIADNANPMLKTLAAQTVQEIKNAILSHRDDIVAISYYNPDGRIYRSGTYLICYGACHTLNDDILPRLEMFHLNLYSSSLLPVAKNFYYPYSVNPLDIFGELSQQREIASILMRIQEKSVHQEKYSFCMHTIGQLQKQNIFNNNADLWHILWQKAYSHFFKSSNIEFLPVHLLNSYSNNMEEKCRHFIENFQRTPCNIELTSDLFKINEVASNYKPICTFFDDSTSIDDDVKNYLSFLILFIETLFCILAIDESLSVAYYFKKGMDK